MMEKPLILVTNDDGVFAPGLRMLISVAREFGKVIVVAPDSAMSGMSHAITVKTPLRLRKIAEEEDYVEYSCNGTPVDAVKLGEKVVAGKTPDLVLSGINHGSNASVNVIYSGTMAAVIEACMDGIPAVGFSLLDYSHNASFEGAIDYIRNIVKNVLKNSLPQGVCLNVNIPAVDKSMIKGVKVCRQATGRWEEAFDQRIDPYSRHYYWLTGVFMDGDTAEDTDSWALANNYISVVPVKFDLTAHESIEIISKWIE
jgi:5'-nucleotidase